jgi:O-antigen/teichoic acid export membrane protein
MALTTSDQEATANLRSRVMHGIAWTGSAAIAVQGSRLLFAVVLARLLTPHEYGIAGMALVFTGLVLGISDFGLGAALVQRTRITEADRSTVFWTCAAIGVALSALGVAASGLVAGFFGEPAVQPLFAAVSIGFVLTGLGRVQAALFQRDMRFRAISVRTMAGTLAGGITGVTLAALGFGAWALVGMHLATGAVTTVLLWTLSSWHPRFVFSIASLRDLGGFGSNVFGSRFLEYLHRNADKILVGRVLGSSALGYYNVAYNLVVTPYVALLVAMVDAVFPAMSRVQDDIVRVAAAWLRATRMILAVTVPATFGLIVVAPDFIGVLLGAKWSPAVPVLQFVAGAIVVNAATTLAPTVLTALDRTGLLLRFNLAEVAVVTAAVVIGLQWGIVGVAACYLVAVTLTRSVLTWLTARVLALPPLELLRVSGGVLQAAVPMVLVVLAGRLALVEAGVPAAVRLLVLPLTGVLVYVPLCVWRAPDLAQEVRRDILKAAAGRFARARRLAAR